MARRAVEASLVNRRTSSRINTVRTTSSPVLSRRFSSTGGTCRDEPAEHTMPSTKVQLRRPRNSLGKKIIQDSDDELSARLSSPSMAQTPDHLQPVGKDTVSRASVSSGSTTNDQGTSSDYSTPATSAFATPAPISENGNIPRQRGGRPLRVRPLMSSLASSLPPAAVKAFQRAKSLRNSEYALVPASTKRKRLIYDDGEEDLEDEEDGEENSADAQLARALQEKEDANAHGMREDSPEQFGSRRAMRTFRTIRPKADFVTDFSDEYDSNRDNARSKQRKVPSNKKSKTSIPDSDEVEMSASSSDDDIPLARMSSTRIASTSGRAPSFEIKTEVSEIPIKGTGLGQSVSNREDTEASLSDLDFSILDSEDDVGLGMSDEDEEEDLIAPHRVHPDLRSGPRDRYEVTRAMRRAQKDRARLEVHHPELLSMWQDLEDLPEIKQGKAEQPTNISRQLKPFQLEGLNWMKAMEKTEWGGGLLGDEMGMGKTIQAVSLIMSDYPAKSPSLVLIPPVALMQWQQEMGDYTDGTLKTFVFHGTNQKSKGITVKELRKYDVILMSYNSLESLYRHQEKGFRRKDKLHFEKSVIHQIQFHRVILDEAHNIKQRTTGVAKACFALKADHKWCLSGTPLQNRIGEFFSLVRFLDIRPFACYFCKQCPCTMMEWSMGTNNRCTGCNHTGMQHVSLFNHELLNPIQKYGNKGPGKEAFAKLRLLTNRFMLRRVKRDHSAAMELPAKEIHVDRQFFGEEENDFAGSIMNNGTRKFETYVAQGVLLNNYANIFGLIMQMRQVADHPDLILKKNSDGGQNILVCCICDEVAEDAIRSACKHDFCRTCVKNYLQSSNDVNVQPDCPRCHIPLSIDLEQPELEQDEQTVKKSSIINRIKMENWTSSSKIEALVYDIHALRSNKSSTKSIVFSQFTTMLQLVEWRLRRAGITTVMLDGSMTPAQRQASINAFMTNPNIECFLVSLKAGGVALNLTEASKVFIVDPWWNPAAEWQSADRCHRIGQCRPCSITRLCIEDSVESRMVLLQEKKANMINSTINNDEAAMESLTPQDMQFLFRGT